MSNRERTDYEETLANLGSVLRGVDEEEVAALQAAILEAGGIHLAGAGRSGLVARAFAMRLTQLGLRVHVLGEASAPAFGKEDLLIVCSASGASEAMQTAAERAIRAGGKVALVTGGVLSSLGRLADLRLTLPPVMPAASSAAGPIVQEPAALMLPLRILFDQAAFVLLDILASRLMRALGQRPEELEARGPNLV